MIKNKRAYITRCRHIYLILNAYSDVFECYRYMTYDIAVVQK